MRNSKKFYQWLFYFMWLLPLSAYAQTEEKEVAEQTLKFINEYRQSKGLTALVAEINAYEQSLQHSFTMARKDQLSHDGFDKRMKNIMSKIRVNASAENVAYNFGEDNPAQAAVKGWIGSKGHHKNMLGNYSHTGLSVVKTSDGKYFFTQIFIKIPQ